MSAILHDAAPRAESAELDRLTARLGAADRCLQQEEAALIVLRSWRWLAPFLFGALAADVLLHLSAPVRLGWGLGLLALLLGIFARAVWIGCFRKSPLEHTARVLEARHPRLGSKLINLLQLRAQTRDPELAPLTRELAGLAIAHYAGELASSRSQAARPHGASGARGEAARGGAARFAGDPRLRARHHPHGSAALSRSVRRSSAVLLHAPRRSATRRPMACQVIYGQSLLITAKAAGHRPGELFLTFLRPASRRWRRRCRCSTRASAASRSRSKASRRTWSSSRTRKTGTRCPSSAASSVILTPRLEKAWVKITPPAYTGLPPDEKPLHSKSSRRSRGARSTSGSSRTVRCASGQLDGERRIGIVQRFALAPESEQRGERRDSRRKRRRSCSFRSSIATASLAGNVGMRAHRHARSAAGGAGHESGHRFVRRHGLQGRAGDRGERRLRRQDAAHSHRRATASSANRASSPSDRVALHARETLAFDFQEMGLASGDTRFRFSPRPSTTRRSRTSRAARRSRSPSSPPRNTTTSSASAPTSATSRRNTRSSLNEFHDLVEEQKKLGEEIAALKEQLAAAKPTRKRAAAQQKLDELLAKQNELNAQLNKLADTMENFVRDQPLYDIEAELKNTLAEEGAGDSRFDEGQRGSGEERAAQRAAGQQPRTQPEDARRFQAGLRRATRPPRRDRAGDARTKCCSRSKT